MSDVLLNVSCYEFCNELLLTVFTMGVTGAAGEITPRERPSEFAERLGFLFIKSGVSGRFFYSRAHRIILGYERSKR